MNRQRITYLAACLALATSQWASAQTPPTILSSQPAELRLWLKADDLVTAGLQDGDPITPGVGWTDASQYGTILAPRTEGTDFGILDPSGPFGSGPVEEQPHLEFVDINGNMVPTVEFERQGPIVGTDGSCSHDPCQGDPAIDRSGSTDRLYQTNNLDDPNAPGTTFDPLDIGNGLNMVSFMVFNPEFTTSEAIGWQTVFAKRGIDPIGGGPLSVYDFKIDSRSPDLSGGDSGNNNGRFSYVTIDGLTIYSSGGIPTEDVWHVTSLQVLDDATDPSNPSNDTVIFFDDESEDSTMRMTPLDDGSGNAIYADSTPAPGDGPFTPLNPPLTVNRNVGATGIPFGIGGHQQIPVSGEGETFAGNIAELIIFAHDPSDPLSVADYNAVEDYLNEKYFASAGFDADVDMDGDVDGADFLIIQRDFPSNIPDWQAQYAGPLSASTAVPEPASAALLSLVVLVGLQVRKR
ncbi:MAG: hypothetical protein AAGD11_11175 [Planctomycetota bacterium]